MTSISVKQTVSNHDLHYLLTSRSIGVQYQPIVDINSCDIFAWEALARFRGENGATIPPNLVFQALHFSPLSLFQMEHRVKTLQLANAPSSGQLFINIDQDAFDLFKANQQNPLAQMLRNSQRVVVEIIENSSISDARISAAMGEVYTGLGIPLALDDVGALDSMVDLTLLPKVDYLKLSLDWIKRIRKKEDRLLLETLIDFAKKTGKKTILEGVETATHLNLAHELGVDYTQGFLYRALFKDFWQDKAKNTQRSPTKLLAAE